MGWRLVMGLAGLAAVALVVSLAVVALVPDREGRGPAERVHPSLAGPWGACARAVREHLADREVAVTGPTKTRWEQSGAGVDLTGRAEGTGIGSMAFGCHAIRLGEDWQVDRLIFTEG